MVSSILHRGKRFLKRRLKRFLGIDIPIQSNPAFEVKSEVYPVISNEQSSMVKDAVQITFVGDLILLRNMVQSAWDDKKQEYDFSPMFEYVKDIFRESDLTIGVFEGPLAGENASYSTSNFDDNIPIVLNFPDSFASAVQDAGVDVVTLANNHIYDYHKDGLLRTLDTLDKIGLKHVGGYRNEFEKRNVFFTQVKDIKIAIIASTYCPNYCTDDFFTSPDTNYMTYGLVSPESPLAQKCCDEMIANIKKAKEGNPDMIIALPHMGTQFSSESDAMQRYWAQLLADEGVDIILSCHAHHVQPIEWLVRSDGKKTPVVYCPGNFINSYIEHEGDLSMIVNLYVSRREKSMIAIGCTPIYATTINDDRFVGIPFYAILKESPRQISYNEYKHLSTLHNIFSNVVLRKRVSIDQVQKEYLIFEKDGYVRQLVSPLMNTGNNRFINLIKDAEHICFIGDSITEGSFNGGYGWYEPLMSVYPEKAINRIAFSGATSITILKKVEEELPLSELFVIAIGCNDIRYRDDSICAMNATDYISKLNSLVSFIIKKNPDSHLVFISPWQSADFDPYCKVNTEQKLALYKEYDVALKEWCLSHGYEYLNPNIYIRKATHGFKKTDILKDHIHPNADDGIRVYSQSVLF